MPKKTDGSSLVSVHLIKTPLCGQELFDDVYELLESFEGPIVFHQDTFGFSLKEFPFLEEQGGEEDIFSLLSWEEIFSLCEYFRLNADINEQDFVALLTAMVRDILTPPRRRNN